MRKYRFTVSENRGSEENISIKTGEKAGRRRKQCNKELHNWRFSASDLRCDGETSEQEVVDTRISKGMDDK
jgi:hypothetical protein